MQNTKFDPAQKRLMTYACLIKSNKKIAYFPSNIFIFENLSFLTIDGIINGNSQLKRSYIAICISTRFKEIYNELNEISDTDQCT